MKYIQLPFVFKIKNPSLSIVLICDSHYNDYDDDDCNVRDPCNDHDDAGVMLKHHYWKCQAEVLQFQQSPKSEKILFSYELWC